MHGSNEGIFKVVYNGFIYLFIVTANTLEVKSAFTSTMSCSYKTRNPVHCNTCTGTGYGRTAIRIRAQHEASCIFVPQLFDVRLRDEEHVVKRTVLSTDKLLVPGGRSLAPYSLQP